MIVEIGHFALVLALAAALAQTVIPFWGARVGDIGLMNVGRNAALIQLALIALAFAALVNAHLTSDFSVLNVAENSNVAMPAIYKISGVWGNHEGSMLLWVFILAIFGALVALFGRALPHALTRRRARRSGPDQRRLPRLHPLHLEPVRAARRPRRSRDATSIRSCRTPASRSTRPCSISAMSASRLSFRSPPRL